MHLLIFIFYNISISICRIYTYQKLMMFTRINYTTGGNKSITPQRPFDNWRKSPFCQFRRPRGTWSRYTYLKNHLKLYIQHNLLVVCRWHFLERSCVACLLHGRKLDTSSSFLSYVVTMMTEEILRWYSNWMFDMYSLFEWNILMY